jgi:hypothetical protein
VYGQYSITESGSLYTLTTQTAMKLADGLPNGCSLPPGTEEATFPASSTDGNGPAIYEGTEKTWYTNTCGYSSMYTATLGVLSPNKMVMTGAITLIRAGSTPSQPSAVPSSPAASSPATSSAASSPTPVAEQSCSSPTSNQETGTEQAESILTGDGYRPVNSLVDTSEEVTINGGALGLNSTGAEAVLMMMGADGQTPTEFISGLNMAADHSVKTAASACGSYGAVIVTGSEANVITLMHEDAYGTNPLYG